MGKERVCDQIFFEPGDSLGQYIEFVHGKGRPLSLGILKNVHLMAMASFLLVIAYGEQSKEACFFGEIMLYVRQENSLVDLTCQVRKVQNMGQL